MTEVSLQLIAELSRDHQGRPIEDLVQAIRRHYPNMSVAEMGQRLKEAAAWCQAQTVPLELERIRRQVVRQRDEEPDPAA